MPADLRTERRGATLVLSFADPTSRNRLGEQTLVAGIEAITIAESDASLRCVVLRGDGADFCAGSDTNAAPGASAAEAAAAHWSLASRLGQFAEALRTFPGPVIGAVEGLVGGAGLALVLACDLVVAAEDARFAGSSAAPGAVADAAAQAVFADGLPRGVALDWLWLGDARSLARKLHALGLLHQVCTPGNAVVEACALAERVAALPDSLRVGAKAQLDIARRATLAQQIAQARDRLSPALLRSA
jgi:enoyl-CoA hydratase/carnithine racemase